MKAHKIQQEDSNLNFPQKNRVRKTASTLVESQLAKSDVEIVRRSLESLKTRNERIEALKAKINAGTYQVDSTALAQKMIGASGVQRLLGMGRYSILDYGDEE